MNLAIYETQILRKRRLPSPGRILSAADAAWTCRDMVNLDREHLVRLDLDARCNLIGRETVHIGTADSAVISPREVLRGAILNGAINIIILHNHPSGESSPSKEDLRVTKLMTQAGKSVGIEVVDSLIIGHGGTFFSCSFHTAGQVRQRHRQLSQRTHQRSLLSYSFTPTKQIM